MRIEYAITFGKDGPQITHRVIRGGDDDGGAPVPIDRDPGGAPVPIDRDPGGGPVPSVFDPGGAPVPIDRDPGGNLTGGCGCETVIVLGPTIIMGGGGRRGPTTTTGVQQPLINPVVLESVPNRDAARMDEAVSDATQGAIATQGSISEAIPEMRGQEQWYWCWAAVGSAVRKFMDSADISQCKVADLMTAHENLGMPPLRSSCEDPGPSNKPKSLMKTLALLTNLENPAIGCIASFPLIKRETAAGRPIGARIGWYTDGVEEGAHFVLISGWETVDGVDMVQVLDPAAGMTDPAMPGTARAIPTITPRSIPYRELREAYIGTGKWVSSYFVKEMD